MSYSTPSPFSVGMLVGASHLDAWSANVAALYASAGVLPVGVIAWWATNASLIPGGWAVCDGGNGTPDLRERFLVGAGLFYGAGGIGPGGAFSYQLPAHSGHNQPTINNHSTHDPGDSMQVHSQIQGFPPYYTSAQVPNSNGYHQVATVGAHDTHIGATLDGAAHGHDPISLLPPFVALNTIKRLANPYSYTAPREWNDGDVPTAAMLNVEFRDNAGYLLARTLPQASILAWAGSLGSIPAGWAVCNGDNGTVDLRDKFIFGAGPTYTELTTGGAATVTLPAHSAHVTTQPLNHGDHYVQTPPHAMNVPVWLPGGTLQLAPDGHSGEAYSSHDPHTGLNASNHAAHDPVDIRPSYYALAFIQLIGGSPSTTPKTWVDGEIVAAADLNTYDRDNGLAIFSGQFPIGAIAAYESTAPAGFAVCDGSSGTPDLRAKFLVGATGGYAMGATGGNLVAFVGPHADHTMTNPGSHAAHIYVSPATNFHPGGYGFSYSPGGNFTSVPSGHVAGASPTPTGGSHSHSGAAADPHSAHDAFYLTPRYYALNFIQRIS